jgi:hypothetical protein
LRVDQERRSRGVTFCEVAHDYMRWLADVAGAKPSTLRNRESVLGEPGVPRKRGEGATRTRHGDVGRSSRIEDHDARGQRRAGGAE